MGDDDQAGDAGEQRAAGVGVVEAVGERPRRRRLAELAELAGERAALALLADAGRRVDTARAAALAALIASQTKTPPIQLFV